MVIEGSLGHPRPLDDRVPPGGGIPDLAEHLNRGIEDLSPGGFGSNLARHRFSTSGIASICLYSGPPASRYLPARRIRVTAAGTPSRFSDLPAANQIRAGRLALIASAARRLRNWRKHHQASHILGLTLLIDITSAMACSATPARAWPIRLI